MSEPTITGQVVELQFRVNDADWLGLFDRLEVWRGPSIDGPYTELTAVQWRGARVPVDGGDPSAATGPGLTLAGKTISLLLNELTQVDITLAGPDPLTLADVATQINAGTHLVRSWVASDGRLVIETVEPGNVAILHILSTDGASLVGLPTALPSSVGYGKDARLQLIAGQIVYPFVDFHSDPSFFYKTRFRNVNEGTLSAFSLPVQKNTVVDPSQLILGTLDLVDARGRPVQNREVSISSKFTGTLVNGRGLVPVDQTALTDVNGHVEFYLLRGLSITVSIAGTRLARDVTVPTDPALLSFSLLDPSVGTDDVFAVQVPDIDFAVRRAL